MTFYLHDGSLTVPGAIYVGNDVQGFKPVTWRQERFRVTFTVNQVDTFVLELSDPARAGTTESHQALIRDNSTMESPFFNDIHPGRLLLKSRLPDTNYNLARVQIEDATCYALGNLGYRFRGATHTFIRHSNYGSSTPGKRTSSPRTPTSGG